MKNRSLVIIGPGKHFGKEIALRFAREGFSVGLIGRTDPNTSSLAKTLLDRGINCYFGIADVANRADIQKVLINLYEKLGSFDNIIYNVKSSSSLEEITKDETNLTKDFKTNVIGAFNVISVIKEMQINSTLTLTGGGFKDKPDHNRLGLSLSKAALHNLFLALEPSLKENGVFLKTLIIDGYVRENGPIFPKDVANSFYEIYNSNKNQLTIS